MVGAEGGAEQSELRVPGKNMSCSLRWVADERAKDPGFFYNCHCNCSSSPLPCPVASGLGLVLWSFRAGVDWSWKGGFVHGNKHCDGTMGSGRYVGES